MLLRAFKTRELEKDKNASTGDERVRRDNIGIVEVEFYEAKE